MGSPGGILLRNCYHGRAYFHGSLRYLRCSPGPDSLEVDEMTDFLSAAVIEDLFPLVGYGLIYGMGLASIVAALSWMVLTFSKLMHKIT